MRKVFVTSVLLFLGFVVAPSVSEASQTVHKVKSGDNLYTIAKKYKMSVDVLKKQNHLKSIKLSLGQSIIIKENETKSAKNNARTKTTAKKEELQAAAVSAEEPDAEFIEYKTKKGDTIEKVAVLFSVDKDDLIESNAGLQGSKNRRLSPGRTILVPRVVDEGTEEIVTLNTKPLKAWKNNDEKYMLVKVAKSFMGAPYKYGGNSVTGLDCSGYVKKIYEIFDVQLPRSARDQIRVGPSIGREDLAVGDLVFFKTRRYAKYPTHVGIYIGDGNFIHSSSGHGRIGVKIDALSSDYYSKAYVGATRVKGATDDDTSSLGKAANNS